ncbi:MAG: hypothetical protein NVSMB27_22280 [Ktedonobacteraceae bacterium]
MSMDITANADPGSEATDITANTDVGNQATTNGVTAIAVLGDIAVLTHHNDPIRLGANLNEQTLTTANVKLPTFGKLFDRNVDSQIYAQILYVSNVNIRNHGTHNVVYVATMANTLYAFDADDPLAHQPLWWKNLGPSVPLPDPHVGGGSGYNDIAIEIGIVSTPVISLDIKDNGGDGTLYVVAMTKESNEPAGYQHHLHALDISSGDELLGGPVQIAASVPGSKTMIDHTKNPVQTQTQQVTRTFTSYLENQRSALLLSQNRIFIAFASFGDHNESENNPYHGWVLSYDATTLKQMAAYNVTPHYTVVRSLNNKNQVRTDIQAQGGIWQAGQGPSVDSDGNIHVITGNGLWKQDGSVLTDSIIKLDPDLRVLDWFSPFNSQNLTNTDADLGSSGTMHLPGTDLVLGGGKESKFYVLHKNQMGHFNPKTDDERIAQWFYIRQPDDPKNPFGIMGVTSHHIHGGPVCWDGPKGIWVYIWVENDGLKAFQFVNGRFDVTSTPQGPVGKPSSQGKPLPQAETLGMPGGALTLSANGKNMGSGIVWASHPHSQQFGRDANQHVVLGILRAYDASNLSNELWNSEMNPADSIGNFAKFNPPTIANGKVYLASFGRGNVPSNQQITQQQRNQIKTTYHFSVYGLKS